MPSRFERLDEDIDARTPEPLVQETWPDTGPLHSLFTAARQLIASNIDAAPKDVLRGLLVDRIYTVIDDQVVHQTSTSTQLRNFIDSLDRIGFVIPEYRRNSFETYHQVLLGYERERALQDTWATPRQARDPAASPLPEYLQGLTIPPPSSFDSSLDGEILQDLAAADGYGDVRRDLADTAGLIYRRGSAPVTRGVVYPGDPTIYPVLRGIQVPSFEIARPDPLLVPRGSFFEERDALPGGFHPVPRDRATIEAETQERLAALERRSGPRTQATLDDIGPTPTWDYDELLADYD